MPVAVGLVCIEPAPLVPAKDSPISLDTGLHLRGERGRTLRQPIVFESVTRKFRYEPHGNDCDGILGDVEAVCDRIIRRPECTPDHPGVRVVAAVRRNGMWPSVATARRVTLLAFQGSNESLQRAMERRCKDRTIPSVRVIDKNQQDRPGEGV